MVDDKYKLLGMVSEQDLLAALDDGHKLGAVAAGDIMTGNPLFGPSRNDALDTGSCVQSQ